jgi:hypothetical protein
MGPSLFIRDDDVWTLDQEFRFFFDLAIERSIPVVYAVIPGKMDEEAVRFLRAAKEKTPHLLDIVQHGWVHANHSVDGRAKYEFGPTRSLEVQRDDVQRGLKEMRRAFEDHLTPAFVPPYHGFDSRTLQVLSEEDFLMFSAGDSRPEIKKRFLDLPAQVSFTSYEPGKTIVHRANDVIADLVRGSSRRSLSGVLLHHADFKTAALGEELTRFFDRIEALRVKEGYKTVLFSQMLAASRKG